MKKHADPLQKALPEGEVPVQLPKPPKRGWRLLISLLACGALFVGAFGLGLLLQTKNRVPSFLSGIWKTEEKQGKEELPKSDQKEENDLPPEDSKSPDDGQPEESDSPPEQDEATVRKEHLSPEKSLQNHSVYQIEETEWGVTLPEKAIGEDPLVLILCTHGSECYADGSFLEGLPGDVSYSDDPARGVLAIAEILAKELTAKGVKAVFCSVNHDLPTLTGATRRAGESVEALLEEYPGICYVIDIRRECILASDGALIGCVAEKDGISYAQISALVGSDGDGSKPYSWRENLALSCELGKRLNNLCPEVFRSVTIENSPYNQNLAKHSIQLRVGAAGNSVEEAKASAKLLAEAFAEYLSEN